MGGIDSYRIAERMHDYSSLFSYASWSKTLNTGSPKDVQNVFWKYDGERLAVEQPTYLWYLSWVYKCLLKSYRNEYVYKNELVNKHILRHFGKTTSIAVNEFRVADSVADLALFNGESKCFEIKSDLDSPQRLVSQMDCYQRVFEHCYILVPADAVNEYKQLVDDRVGVLTLKYCRNGKASIKVEQEAQKNEKVDVDVLMRSVRSGEYRWIVKQAYGKLPDVTDFEMYDACKDRLRQLTDEQLHTLFRESVKLRNSRISNLMYVSPIFRQMSLSLNLSQDNVLKLHNVYNQIII